MKLIQTFRKNKNVFLPLICLIALTFIYGCRCEGGIGNSSNSSDTIELVGTQPKSK